MSRWMCLSILLLGLASTSAVACLWDYDTLKDERRGLPGIAEVLAGKWEKHSRFFYEHRVEKMKALLARDPTNLAAYDNLAVAYEKLDDRPAAVVVMEKKEAIKPGEYTTYANLGTFYLHAGDFENGIAYIRKALAINPAAHFGREEYQLKLAEFYRDGRENPKRLEDANFLGIPAERVNSRHGSPDRLKELGLKDNVFDGIVGIIRFGTGTSAELYLTLGDLLALRGDKNLAVRAYQRAIDLGHPRQDYLKEAMADAGRGLKDETAVKPQVIQAERAAAEAWVAAYQDYEDDLIRAGKDVDDEANYAAFYRLSGPAVASVPYGVDDLRAWFSNDGNWFIFAAALAVLAWVLSLARRTWKKHLLRRQG